MRSRAPEKSSAVIVWRPARTAKMAASFTRFARSAPENPGVLRATTSKSTSALEGLALRVDGEDRGSFLLVRQGDLDVAVEPPGAQERRVEDLRAIRRREHHHAGRPIEPVHLREQLVQRLLAFVVRREPGAAPLADRVDLVDEDDRGCPLLRVGEQVANARGPDTDEELDEARAGDREERTPASPATARARSVLPVPGGPTISTPRGPIAPAFA